MQNFNIERKLWYKNSIQVILNKFDIEMKQKI